MNYTVPIYGHLILKNSSGSNIRSIEPCNSSLLSPQAQAMMGLSDMDHMVAEAVTSEQAGRIGVGP